VDQSAMDSMKIASEGDSIHTNIIVDKDKDFQNSDIRKKNAKPIQTLPSVVTVCLASCDLCTGEYVNTTHSFRLRCLCKCGHREKRS
jgi:hypothetical protein